MRRVQSIDGAANAAAAAAAAAAGSDEFLKQASTSPTVLAFLLGCGALPRACCTPLHCCRYAKPENLCFSHREATISRGFSPHLPSTGEHLLPYMTCKHELKYFNFSYLNHLCPYDLRVTHKLYF